MAFQIRYDANNRLVRVAFFGRVQMSEKIAAARQTAEKFGHLQPLRLMVDVREASIELSLPERRQFGRFAARLAGLSHARVGVLHAPDRNANVAINSAAQAAGMNLVEFVSEGALLNWLLSETRDGAAEEAGPTALTTPAPS